MSAGADKTTKSAKGGLTGRVPDLSTRVADLSAKAALPSRVADLSARVPSISIRHRAPRRSDPAAGPALPESLTRVRRPKATTEVIARTFEADLSAPVVAAGTRITNVRQVTERVAMGRALWRELVVGFSSQLGELNLGFTQLAALYVLAEGATTTIADLAEAIGRSPSATSRLVDGLERRRLVERRREADDGRLRTVWLTPRGQAVLRMVDRARAEQFLAAVRPLPRGERALIAMGVAALATHAISRRGRLVRGAGGLQAPAPNPAPSQSARAQAAGHARPPGDGAAYPQKRQTTS
ncbi:MAG TPA: MarR family transcriptional regulator [Candidatus Limnocylindrales bacterium]